MTFHHFTVSTFQYNKVITQQTFSDSRHVDHIATWNAKYIREPRSPNEFSVSIKHLGARTRTKPLQLGVRTKRDINQCRWRTWHVSQIALDHTHTRILLFWQIQFQNNAIQTIGRGQFGNLRGKCRFCKKKNMRKLRYYVMRARPRRAGFSSILKNLPKSPNVLNFSIFFNLFVQGKSSRYDLNNGT